MRKIKRKLGIVYWIIIKKYNAKKYKYRTIYTALREQILGLFINMPIDLNALSKANCLIICAHPDDETIFFYSVIKELNPYVICMSNKGNKIRRAEFEEALKYLGVNGVLLNFLDTQFFDWKYVRPFILRRLRVIRKYSKNVEFVYTHNNEGEPNHTHHIALSRAVQRVFYDKHIYLTSSDQIDSNAVLDYDDKEYVMKAIYKSQYQILYKWCKWFQHYMKYEYFEEADKRI